MNEENISIQSNQKFTSGNLGLFVRLPLTKHNMAMASLLCRMQMNESELFPDPGLQQVELQQRYSFQFEAVVQLFGKEMVISYLANFVEPQEILDPDYNYRQIAETFAGLATRPLITPSSVQLAQRQLEEEYQELMAEPSNAALSAFSTTGTRTSRITRPASSARLKTLRKRPAKKSAALLTPSRPRPAAFLAMSMMPARLSAFCKRSCKKKAGRAWPWTLAAGTY